MGTQNSGVITRAYADTSVPPHAGPLSIGRSTCIDRAFDGAPCTAGANGTEGRDPSSGHNETRTAGRIPPKVRREKQNMAPTVDELCKAMRADPSLAGIGYDVLSHRVVARNLPWDGSAHAWRSADDSNLYCIMQRDYGAARRSDVADALVIMSQERPVNPIVEMLENLPEWDGRARAAHVFTAFLGAPADGYIEAACHCWLCAAVERAYVPGTKFDSMPILVGAQGIGKSSLLRLLAMRTELFTDAIPDLTKTKESGELIRGKWIVELPELIGMRRRDSDAVKGFVSKQFDEYREAYGRHVVAYQRACVFAGTTNRSAFLSDTTGARRYWPIPCGALSPSMSPFDADAPQWIAQVWAEIVAKRRRSSSEDHLREGEYSLLLPERYAQDAERARAEFEAEDPFCDPIREYLERHASPGARTCVNMVAAEALNLDPTSSNRTDKARIADILDNKMPGWKRMKGKQRANGLERGKPYGAAVAWEFSAT